MNGLEAVYRGTDQDDEVDLPFIVCIHINIGSYSQVKRIKTAYVTGLNNMCDGPKNCMCDGPKLHG